MSESKQPKKSTGMMQPLGISVTIPCIAYSSINFGREKVKLGKGSYGAVFSAQINFNTVAVKEFIAEDFSDKTKRQIDREAKVMAEAGAGSNYLVRLNAFCLEPYCLVMDYMPGGDLYHLLHSEQEIPWEKRYLTGLNMSSGLYHLHDKGILHRDLKSLNVLLTSKHLDTLPIAKLCDFGMATLKNSSSTSTKGGFQGGTYAWTAPELFIPDTEATPASDIYSLGMVFWELASREDPYKKAGKMASMWIMQGKKETFPLDTPTEFKAIAEECWQSADKRPTALQVAQRLERLWEEEQSKNKEKAKQSRLMTEEISVSQPPPSQPKMLEEKKHTHLPERKVLADDSQFLPVQSVDRTTLDSRKIVQINDLLTPTSAAALMDVNSSSSTSTRSSTQLAGTSTSVPVAIIQDVKQSSSIRSPSQETQPPVFSSSASQNRSSSVAAQSTASTPSLHASSSAFFPSSSATSTSSSKAKTKTTRKLNEKERKRLMPLQNELVKACENGSLSRVKAALAKGALVDLPSEQGKNPLYSAVWGMNPELVKHLIRLLPKDANPSWKDCEIHNKKHYGRLFLNLKFNPTYYKEWHDLLIQIEPNEYLADYHLAQARKVWGEGDKDCASYEALKSYTKESSGARGRPEPEIVRGRFCTESTEEGYEVSRNQIRKIVEALQVAKTTQYAGVSLSVGDEKLSNPPGETLKTPEREIVELDNLFTPVTSATLSASSSNSSTSSVQSASSSLFGRLSAALFARTASPEAKTKSSTGLDEKEHKRLMPLQNELIKACESGSLSRVKAAIAKGARPDLVNKKGKNPIYCAVWGMNPKVVTYLTGLLLIQEGAKPVTWRECEAHNKKYYNQMFFNIKFDPEPKNYKNWCDLLIQIEPNEFLVECFLLQGGRRNGEKSFKGLKKMLNDDWWFESEGKLEGRYRHARWQGWNEIFIATADGYRMAREQITQHLEQMELQMSSKQTGAINTSWG